jgi:hypothetical protein
MKRLFLALFLLLGVALADKGNPGGGKGAEPPTPIPAISPPVPQV